jgi:hypothetical protein
MPRAAARNRSMGAARHLGPLKKTWQIAPLTC